MDPEEVKRKAHALANAGASAEEIETFVRDSVGQPAPEPVDAEPSYAQKALGGVASLAREIPGAEALQAGARSFFRATPEGEPNAIGFQRTRNQPYGEALSDIRTAEDANPASTANRLLGGGMAAAAGARLPLSPGKAGALFGGATQALSADDQSLTDRAARTAVGTGVGGAFGKVLDIGGNLARAWKPGRPTSGKLTQGIESNMKKTDRVKYGAARSEAQASPPQIAAVRRILDRPNVKTFADDVRSSEQFAKADDGTVLTEVYSSMSAAERSLKRALSAKYDPAVARELIELRAAKNALLKEADKVMPSFRGAVKAHAEAEGEMAAVGTGVSAAKRVMGATPGGKQLRKESVEKYAEKLREMTPENRKKAVAGALAETRQRTGFQPNAISFGGLLTSIQRPMKMASFLREAGDEGQALADRIAKMILAGGSMAGQ